MEVISQDLIELDIDLSTKKSIISYIVDKMGKQNRAGNVENLEKDIYLRESEASTSMGFGVAIPHAQSDSVLEASIVFLRTKEEICWGNDKDVRMIFGIFVPSSNPDNQHLKLLAKLARRLVSDEFRNELLKIDTVEECERMLQEISEY